MAHPRDKRWRLKEGVKRAQPAFESYYGKHGCTPEDDPGKFGVLRKTRKLCSCPLCCGNPRRLKKGAERFTLQERKSLAPKNED